MNSEELPGLERGQLVRDTARDQVGEVMDFVGGRVQLRPLAGGREWDADRERVTVLDARESLRVRVAVENRRSRWGVPR
ncbi:MULTISPECIES: hypothetical protein [Streptomyces]|uniref:Uncharacterized protein n=1 Tax=Streptomyces aidingensis TaxID=910347 RepID=A0A1I1RHB2_9ACTN|nr:MULTISPECIES: hypothetical protein [Streptomyces]SFD33507.1 hypothetical protein SAMN05421773_11390 [Streptomyces aidingensis]